MEVTKGKETKIVLTKPFQLEAESDFRTVLESPQSPTSLVKFTQERAARIRSQQTFNCRLCLISQNLNFNALVNQCTADRFTSVVAWSISTTRPTSFGVASYNPTLGETHHVSKGNLNVLVEHAGFTQPSSICAPCNR